jgi:hypothetical protein
MGRLRQVSATVLGDRQGAARIAQVGVGGLQVERRRVMNARADAVLVQVFQQCIALAAAQHIEVPDWFGGGRNHRPFDGQIGEQFAS